MYINKNNQKGFGLVIIILAILIIALIVFGTRERKGTIEQSQEIKTRATDDLNIINDNLQKNNEKILGEM